MSEERLQMCQDVLVTKPFQVQGTLQKEGEKESKDPALNLLQSNFPLGKIYKNDVIYNKGKLYKASTRSLSPKNTML